MFEIVRKQLLWSIKLIYNCNQVDKSYIKKELLLKKGEKWATE